MCQRKIQGGKIYYVAVVWICLVIRTVPCLTQLDKYTKDEATGFWFKYHEIPLNFTDAFLRCRAEGATLASPSNESFTRSMMFLLSKKNLCVSCAIHTGINSFFFKGSYSTVEGIPLSTIPVSWSPGSPDNFENSENCLIMLPNGKLDDKRCQDTYPYICYKSMDSVLANPTCGTHDKGYALDARTGSCYKFHTLGQNWMQAVMTCEAEGGYLTIINSVIEANVLKDLYGKHPDTTIFATYKSVIGIGIHDQFQYKLWLTLKGQTLEEAGFADFHDGQPDNDKTYDGGSHCGAMFRNGRLDDIYCYSVTMPFVCEKDPNFIYT